MLQFTPHASIVHESADANDIDVVYVPGGCTHLLQPADRSWCKPFKVRLRDQWVRWMQQGQRTAQGNLKKPDRQDVINWVSFSWESVCDEVIEKSFKITGISNRLDGSEDNLVDDQIPFEIDDEDELRREAIDIQFDDEGDDSDLDFDGFDENELQY